MRRDERGGAGGDRFTDQGVDDVPPGGVEPGMGLVEEPELGTAGDKNGDGGPAPLPGREPADRDPGQAAGQAQPGEGRRGLFRRRARRASPEADVLRDREVVVQEGGVTEETHPPSNRPAVPPEVVAQDDGFTADDGNEAGAGAQQRGLPGPVGASKEHDLAARDVEIDAGEGGETSEQRDRGAEADDRVHVDEPEATGGPGSAPNRAGLPSRPGHGSRRSARRTEGKPRQTAGKPRHQAPATRRTRLGRVLGAVGRTLITAGVLILLFVVYLLWGTGIHEARAQHRLEREFSELVGGEASTSTTVTTAPPRPASSARPGDECRTKRTKRPPKLQPPAEGSPVAHIQIASIGVDKIVVQGVGLPDLKMGPGHYAETPFPGEVGNVAIAGHRTTYGAPFNRLDEVPDKAIVCLTTYDGMFRYEVTGHLVVRPNQVEVLNQTKDARLTLTTCNPKYSARERFVLQAKLIGKRPPRQGVHPTTKSPLEKNPTVDTAGLGGEGASNLPAILWGAAAALLAFVVWLLAHRRRFRTKWLIYAAGTVPFLVVLFMFFENFSRLLPSNF